MSGSLRRNRRHLAEPVDAESSSATLQMTNVDMKCANLIACAILIHMALARSQIVRADAAATAPGTSPAAFPGKKSQWSGFDRYDFDLRRPARDRRGAEAGGRRAIPGCGAGSSSAPSPPSIGRCLPRAGTSPTSLAPTPSAAPRRWSTGRLLQAADGRTWPVEEAGAAGHEPGRALRLQLGGGPPRRSRPDLWRRSRLRRQELAGRQGQRARAARATGSCSRGL